MSVDFAAIQAWIDNDPDPGTRDELETLVVKAKETGETASAAVKELESRFAGTLQFGTAGLRGELGAGPNRMNRAVVIKAAAGLTAFLQETLGSDFSVVIGHDARHGSVEFVRDTAAVITAAGGRALMLPPQQPTPLLAFALNHLNADAGVMVTASHNPARDNGYKVYLGARPQASSDASSHPSDPAGGAGAQIIPPFDAHIAAHIARIASARDVPRAESGWQHVDESIIRDYLTSITALTRSLGLSATPPANLRIVHTSLHGVGHRVALEALTQAGFTNVTPVATQAQPDSDFPTVRYPNPEEPGTLNLAFRTAAHTHADLILANDPDADRFSAAIPIPGTHTPTSPNHTPAYRQLTGDEVGLLLGEFIAERTRGTLASSVVSSRALAQVAAHHGLTHRTTLTGFKWIARGTDLIYGYEEALGYCVNPQVVRDKDGISAAVIFAHLVAHLTNLGLTVDDELRRIRTRDGIFLTAPLTLRMPHPDLISRTLTKLGSAPPPQLGGSVIAEVVDLSAGSPTLPATPGFIFVTERGDRVVIRPSGTEPKLKCYLESVAAVNGSYPRALTEARATLERMTTDLSLYVE